MYLIYIIFDMKGYLTQKKKKRKIKWKIQQGHEGVTCKNYKGGIPLA